MTQVLHLAGKDDLDRLERMVAAYHAEEAIESDEAHRRAALEPLLEGSPHGAIWMIGPQMAPVGYIAVSFGWSIELGGLDGVLDEFWIREKVRPPSTDRIIRRIEDTMGVAVVTEVDDLVVWIAGWEIGKSVVPHERLTNIICPVVVHSV